MSLSQISSRRCTAFGLSAVCLAISGGALASSHREAPFIARNPSVDGTDFYMFRSYEPGRDKFMTVMANYIPFQDPQGGPNFYQFEPTALYEIHFDTNGDGREDITFQFRFKSTSKQTALPVGGKQVRIPLINSDVIPIQINPASLNVRETFTIDIVRGDRRTGTNSRVTNTNGNGFEFDKPVDNIGDKTFGGAGNYEKYANLHIYNIAIPGCGTAGKVFVGQRKEPFYIAVGKIFDLFNLNPLGPEVDGNKNDLEFKNISTIAMELPIDCIAAPGEPVVGGYTTASLRQARLLNPSPRGIDRASANSGAFSQVSRLGMPLVNEVVIGLDDKDRFNASKPINDAANFADYVTNPTLPAVLEKLFGADAKAPTNFPRTDLLTVFLKGIEGLNQPKNVVPAEMMRLNTSIPLTPAASQSPLGVAGKDNAGFPNGRRPGDDVVDLSLRVAMGALCVLTGDTDALKVGCRPADAPTGAKAFTDGVRRDATSFKTVFPYFNTPIPGNFNN